jgi:hypothetical protein
MKDRERLIELIRYVQYLGGLEEKLADHLIANGVTVQKEGVWIGKPVAGYCDVRCSLCRAVFTANSGKWNYCPNCGAKMGDL